MRLKLFRSTSTSVSPGRSRSRPCAPFSPAPTRKNDRSMPLPGNARVRTEAAPIVNQIDSALAITCYQFTQVVRMMSILGEKMPYSQISGSATYTAKATIGLHYVGHQEISAVSPTPLDDETWTAGTHYRVVHPEFGAFEILELPAGVTEEDEIIWGYTKAAITEGSRIRQRLVRTRRSHSKCGCAMSVPTRFHRFSICRRSKFRRRAKFRSSAKMTSAP